GAKHICCPGRPPTLPVKSKRISGATKDSCHSSKLPINLRPPLYTVACWHARPANCSGIMAAHESCHLARESSAPPAMAKHPALWFVRRRGYNPSETDRVPLPG